jgi:glycosyltransferase involved in cell wall biosynthesis
VTDADVPDADVIVATWWEVAEWVAALTPAKGVKLHLVQGDDRDALRAIGASVERVESAFRQPLIKIAVSDWVAARLADVWTGPIRVIHNGVAARLFHASPRARQTPPRVGFVYADIRIKGMDIAIDAVRIARCECPELEVVSFGNRPPAKQFPLPEQTLYEVTPLQEKLREFYSACDAWLFPSRAEGFGLPILEAMACRTPVIGTPTGAAPELIGQGGGILVPHEDAHAMAQAILRVCRMTATEWRTMSDAAYVTAHRYTWDDATRLFEEALTRAVEQAR